MPKYISQILTRLISLNNKTMNHIQDLILKDDKTVIWATTHLKFTKLKIKNSRSQDGGLGGLSPSLGLEVCITEITFWLSPILILHFFQRWCSPRWGGVGCSSSSSSSGWPARLKAPQKQGSLYSMCKKSCFSSELAVFWGKKWWLVRSTTYLFGVGATFH